MLARFIVMAVSLLIICIGIFGMISPVGFQAYTGRWQTKAGTRVISVVRLGFSIALWIAAPMSRTTVVFRALAMLSVFNAVLLMIAGVLFFKDLLSWWDGLSPGFKRGWSAVGVIVGVFILWSITV